MPIGDLPSFAASLLFLYSTIILFKHNRLDKDFFYLFVLPILLYIIPFGFAVVSNPRNMLPLIPLLIIIAAYGLYNINCKLNKKIFGVILLFVIIYQFSYVFSSESNYINDTRGKMGEWMLEHIDLNSKIYIGDPDNKYLVGGEFEITNKSKVSKNRAINRQGMVIPSEFTTVADFNDADYIVINMPLKYLRSYKNILRDPICCKEVQNCIYNECIFTQNLFRDKLNFKVIKKIEANAFTPELWFYKKFIGNAYESGVMDIFLYEKRNLNKYP